MSKAVRATVVAVATAAVAGLVAWVATVLGGYPPTVAAASSGSGSANLTLQTVAAIGYGTHPTWVSYLVKDTHGKWVHTTVWQLPANSTIHVTLYEFDTQGPLRNLGFGQVMGVDGGHMYVDGKPTNLANANGNDAPAHTFTVPDLGISVPMVGVAADAKNQCATPAPCSLSTAHTTIQFSFHTRGPGLVRWQCFVPCGLGYVSGNGGPMQTLGYMGGFLKVTA